MAAFHANHSSNLKLWNQNRTAGSLSRIDAQSSWNRPLDNILFSASPLSINVRFEIEAEVVEAERNFAVYVITTDPASFVELPRWAKFIPGIQEVVKDLKLRCGDEVGVELKPSGEIHLYSNKKDETFRPDSGEPLWLVLCWKHDMQLSTKGTVPDKPVNLRTESATAETISISWASPPSGLWDKYESRITAEGENETRMILRKDSTTYQFTGLNPATKYTIQLRSVASGVPSDDETIEVFTVPHKPVNLRNESVSAETISISWASPPSGLWDKYESRIMPEGGIEMKMDLRKDLKSFRFTRLNPATKYTIQLRSVASGVLSDDETIEVLTGVLRSSSDSADRRREHQDIGIRFRHTDTDLNHTPDSRLKGGVPRSTKSYPAARKTEHKNESVLPVGAYQMPKTKIVKTCPYWENCSIFLRDLKIPDVYFDNKFDECFCAHCVVSRDERLYYDRGEPPQIYGIPMGWARFSLRAQPQAEAFDVFKKWHVCYHGTVPNNLKCILDSKDLLLPGDVTLDHTRISSVPGHFTEDLKPDGFDTKRIFVSPTIKYAGLPAYANIKSWVHPFTNKTHNLRVALQLRIKPGTYTVGPETVGLTRPVDAKFKNEELEWSTNVRGSTNLTGILVRLDDGHC